MQNTRRKGPLAEACRLVWLAALAAGWSCLPATAQEFLYVTNGAANSIVVINTATNAIVATRANVVGGPTSPSSGPCGVAFTPDGTTGYVAVNNGGNLPNYNVILVIQAGDYSTGPVSTLATNGGSFGVAITPDGKRAYLANQNAGSLSVVDVATNAIVGAVSLTLGGSAFAVAISPDGSRVYASNGGASSVAVINAANNTIVTNIQVGSQPQGIAITPDGSRAYVVTPNSSSVAVIDTASNSVLATVSVGARPNGVAIAGSRAYVTNFNSNNVSVIDTTSNTVVATVPTGSNPIAVTITRDGTLAYVANSGGNSVTAINTSNNSVVATIPVSGPACALASTNFPPRLGGGGAGAGILYYSRTDGSVVALDVNTKTAVGQIPAGALRGGDPGAQREIAFDPVTRLMWYSLTDDTVQSVNVDTLSPGPGPLRGFPGASVGAIRHLFVDYTNRKLLVNTTEGSTVMYNLSNLQPAGTIPSTFFTDGNVGVLRHYASDVRAGTLWYAATDGSFREMNPNTLTLTGRVISFGVQTGANPGAFRHFVIDPATNLLLYNVTDGSVASILLSSLKATSVTISSGAFSGADPGAGRVITYSFNYTASPAITSAGVVHAGSFLAGAVAPGEIISIFGTNEGPSTAAFASFNAAGLIDTILSDTRVLFDGTPAPLFYVQANQINVVVPYGVAGKTGTPVQTEYKGVKSNSVTIPVAASAPGIFTVSSGKGQGAILNQDGSVNSRSNPAAKGSIVVLFATGEGQTNPPGVDGKPSSPPFPTPVLPVSVSIGGLAATDIPFAGGAPGFVGLLQVNVRLPAGVASGDVPVVLTVGSAQSQPGVTLAVQ